MRDQKGEVAIGVMVVMMVGMMIFGGMHLLRGGQRTAGCRAQGGQSQGEQIHDHDDENHAVKCTIVDEQAVVPVHM
jgi:hypothetical protein